MKPQYGMFFLFSADIYGSIFNPAVSKTALFSSDFCVMKKLSVCLGESFIKVDSFDGPSIPTSLVDRFRLTLAACKISFLLQLRSSRATTGRGSSFGLDSGPTRVTRSMSLIEMSIPIFLN